jgi:glycosyltransferase involved in cell wall biosynthesis
MTANHPAVSVIVCTRNRSTFLAKTCHEILDRGYRGTEWEVVIIDNGSTDDTLSIAEQVAAENPERVRVVVEHQLGLSEARNRGIAEARYDLLAFIDDDAFPLDGWLEALVSPFDGDEVMAAGGPVDPMIEGDLPTWFRGRYLPFLTVWDLGAEPLELFYFEYPRGANMAFRKEAFDRWGGFSPYLGRKGASLLSCEETEMFLRVQRGGGKIMYAPGARVRHLTVADRITPGWLLRRCEAQGKSEAIFNWQHAKLKGLRIGLSCQIRRWKAARREKPYSGKLFVRCRREALVGYVKGIPHSILRTPLYRPVRPSDEPAPWLPFG